jgi:hypothetical protein
MSTDLMGIDRQVTYAADAELLANVRSNLEHWCSLTRVLRTTYLDTADFDLLNAGITLRHRTSVGKSGQQGKAKTEAKIPTEEGLLRIGGARAAAVVSQRLGIDLERCDALRPVAVQTKMRRLLLASGSFVAPDFVVALDVAYSDVDGQQFERHEIEAQLFTSLPWKRGVETGRIARFEQFRLRFEREFGLETRPAAGYELVMESAGVPSTRMSKSRHTGPQRLERGGPDEHLYNGLTEGATLKTDTLFSSRPQLIVNASHVQVREHEGLPIVPIAEVFSAPTATFIGFGKPNVFLTIPCLGENLGWEKFAAFMFWRKRSYVANTKGIVQGGMFIEMRNLPERAIGALHTTMRSQQGQRTITCANATGKVLSASGFTSNGKSLARKVRPMTLARTIWNGGLEFDGKAVELRFINTNTGTLDDHFAKVLRKEWSSPVRAIAKLVPAKETKTRAPKIEPRLLQPLTFETPDAANHLELRMGRPSKLAVILRRHWGDHPIFEVRLDPRVLNIETADFSELSAPLRAYPGKLDAVSKIKRYVLFSRPVVRFIRAHMAQEMKTLGRFHGPVLVGMFQRQTGAQPFLYNVIITGTSARMTRLENGTAKDVAKANWLLAKHVLLSGYDCDVRFAGEIWVEDTETGQKLWINNNSGTYKPTSDQAEAAARFLERLIGVEVAVYQQ